MKRCKGDDAFSAGFAEDVSISVSMNKNHTGVDMQQLFVVRASFH